MTIPPPQQPWFLGALLVGMVAALATGRFGADIVMMGVLLALLLAGVLEPSEALSGFASQGLATVAFLYIVAIGMRETGAMTVLTSRLLGRPRSTLEAQARLVLPVTSLSAFVNNTPIVAMFMPVLDGLSRRTGIPASRLFMPLSYASILGGICTLIGTSTNVVVAGLIETTNRERAASGLDRVGELGMFTLAWVGVPIAVVGVTYMLLFGRRLLPDRSDPETVSHENARQYMTALRVREGSAVAGKTVEDAGLRHLPGLFLIRIERNGQTLRAVAPTQRIDAGDTLVFVGILDSVVDLQRIRGLDPITDEEGATGYRPKMRLTECVVSASSPLIGQTVREAGVRTRYGAAVVAVHRQGHRLSGKIGDIRLRQGDTLLLEAPEGFAAQQKDSTDFHLVSELAGSAGLRHERAWIALIILGALVVTITAGWLSPVVAAMAAAGLMIISRCCTGPQARSGIDWRVLIVIGAALGIGQAMEKTGLAASLAHGLVAGVESFGPHAMLAGVYLATVLLTAIMTNNAAAVLMFPVALSVTHEAGLAFLPFAVCICIGASAEFSTPIGYQTNLMVMGPGGYRWLDYTIFGGPLTILVGVMAVALIPLAFPLTT